MPSTSIFNLDGADDDIELSDSEHTSNMAALSAAQLAAEKAKSFQDANFPDDDEAWKKDLKIKFQQHDVEYWFNAVEKQRNPTE